MYEECAIPFLRAGMCLKSIYGMRGWCLQNLGHGSYKVVLEISKGNLQTTGRMLEPYHNKLGRLLEREVEPQSFNSEDLHSEMM